MWPSKSQEPLGLGDEKVTSRSSVNPGGGHLQVTARDWISDRILAWNVFALWSFLYSIFAPTLEKAEATE